MYINRNSKRIEKNKRFKIDAGLKPTPKVANADALKKQNRKRIKKRPVQLFELTEREQALKAILKKEYPLAFNERAPLPISVGVRGRIKQDLIDKGHDCPTKQLYRVLRSFTGSLAYRQAIMSNTNRINLDGSQAEPITDKEKELAMKSLQRYIKNHEILQKRIAEEKKEK